MIKFNDKKIDISIKDIKVGYKKPYWVYGFSATIVVNNNPSSPPKK